MAPPCGAVVESSRVGLGEGGEAGAVQDLAAQGHGRRLGGDLDDRDAGERHLALVGGRRKPAKRSRRERGACQVGGQRVLVHLEPRAAASVGRENAAISEAPEPRAAARGRVAASSWERATGLRLGGSGSPSRTTLLADDLVLDEDREHLGAEGGVVGALARRRRRCDVPPDSIGAAVAGVVRRSRTSASRSCCLGDLRAVHDGGIGRETDVAPGQPERRGRRARPGLPARRGVASRFSDARGATRAEASRQRLGRGDGRRVGIGDGHRRPARPARARAAARPAGRRDPGPAGSGTMIWSTSSFTIARGCKRPRRTLRRCPQPDRRNAGHGLAGSPRAPAAGPGHRRGHLGHAGADALGPETPDGDERLRLPGSGP